MRSWKWNIPEGRHAEKEKSRVPEGRHDEKEKPMKRRVSISQASILVMVRR
jgi:hypothetical protein